MNLYELAKVILGIERDGLSKVRFAKTIYFVHKELVRRDIMAPQDIEYIRMPLGPVPNGFMQLEDMQHDIFTETLHSGLSYNSVNYRLRQRRFFRPNLDKNPLYLSIKGIVDNLHDVSTSVLVEKSHEESSWAMHKNGDIYLISIRDMKNQLPKRRNGQSSTFENQQIQASLVRGMIEDIVSESTDLEYPSDEKESR
jgi:hypothetical protein